MEREILKVSNKKYAINTYDLLGKGAFCNVYSCTSSAITKSGGKGKGKNNVNKKEYVAKVIKNKYKIEFVREINVFNKINKHRNSFLKKMNRSESNIIQLENYYIGDNHTFLIFEKMDCDLYKFVKKFMSTFNSRLPIKIIKKIMISVCNAVHELNYNNLIHADIKSDNIMIKITNNSIKDLNGLFEKYKKNINSENAEDIILNNIQIKLIDLNKCVFINEICKSLHVQTLEYQAPEIVLGDINYNEKIDIWSMGSLLWFLTTGHEFIDVYNYKKSDKNYVYYSDSESESESESDSEYDSNSESDSESDPGTYSYSNQSMNSNICKNNSNEYDYSSDSYSILENFIYLNKLYHLLGPIDDKLIKGRYVGNFYYKNNLIGYVPDSKTSSVSKMIMPELEYFNLNKKEDASKYINTVIKLLNEKIFIYDYKDRINITNLMSELLHL